MFVRDRDSIWLFWALAGVLTHASFSLCLLCTRPPLSSVLLLLSFGIPAFPVCFVTSDVVYCDKEDVGSFLCFVFSRLVAAEGAEPRFMQEEEESSEEEEEELSPKEQG